jgi:outer membrane protein TolC
MSDTIPVLSGLSVDNYQSWIDNRPDVQAAELRLVAAEKRKYNSLTQVLPQLAIGGKLSRQANYRGSDEEEAWDTLDAWAFSTSASVVLFQGGGQFEKIRSASAGVVMAEEGLRKTRLKAQQELEQTLLGERTQEKLLDATEQQAEDALLAYEEARNQYSKGFTPFISVMTTQQVAQQAELLLAQQHREMIRTRFQTYMTLGYSDLGGKK